MKGLAPGVTPDKLIQRLVRSAILAGHTDKEVNDMVKVVGK